MNSHKKYDKVKISDKVKTVFETVCNITKPSILPSDLKTTETRTFYGIRRQ